ncbi:alpha-amylase family glycosyl hydrolase [Devosia submarina]|uniref:alpha-amylase family glycosyl hydrolase n=1 Tax=Devosia submarina TaxID=1173082 RepID=UPI000D3766E6|nr:alpha-amylase family glycosyl hydrolase [Devosia submarina]
MRKDRRYPIGAEPIADGVSFRVWAPDHQSVSLVLDNGQEHAFEPEESGYWSLFAPGLGAGALYRFRLSGRSELLPDPCSRFQPQGVAGPSMAVDPTTFEWSDANWAGPRRQAVYYELHIGTFTQEGTLAAATEKLAWLRDVGVTIIELMPLNTCVGSFGWGYDGVLLFAPTPNYGTPDDLRRFIDRAHALGLGVIHDVVYNHFGPGEICPLYAADYFSGRPANEWGKSMNFDGPNSAPVREFFCSNAAYWIDEFHFDGLRIDATQALQDDGPEHIISALSKAARAAAGSRSIVLVSENEPQQSYQVRSSAKGKGYGLDALWNDDFHHSARVALTGRSEAYFHDHLGRAQEFVSAAKYGFLFQGQRYDWQDANRGHFGLDLLPDNFIHFIQNHDQIANTPGSRRISQLTSPALLRAVTALLLLGPQSPMLFQGQEFGATTNFYYFLDQQGEVAAAVEAGRKAFVSQFPSLDEKQALGHVQPPHERSTFNSSKLNWTETKLHQHIVELHLNLLQLRRTTAAFQRSQQQRTVDGSTISENAFLLRYFGEKQHEDRLLLVNLGSDVKVRSIPDPLYAPPTGYKWITAWSSQEVRYGGTGQRNVDTDEPWVLTAETALLFAPQQAARKAVPSKEFLDAYQYNLR